MSDPTIDTPGTATQGRIRRGWLVWGVIALVAAGLFWRYGARDHLVPRNFGVVEAGHVYRSGRLTPTATRTLHERYGIRTIIDLGAYEPGTPEERVAMQTAKALGITRYRFDLEGDGSGNPNHYVAALRLMADSANHPVLVHCAAGSYRTSGCVILYRHHMQGKSVESVFPEAFGHEYDANKSWKLMAYLVDWSDKIGGALKSGGWVEGWDPPSMEPVIRPDAAGTPAGSGADASTGGGTGGVR
jgi:tyrosine-protein phosphatase SIW14